MGKRKPLPLKRVESEQMVVPDALERLRRAFDLILRAAARAQGQDATQETTPTQNTQEEDNAG